MSEEWKPPMRGSGYRGIAAPPAAPPPVPLPEADWDLWAYMPKATVLQAVELSLGVEPHRPALTYNTGQWPPSYADHPSGFKRRLTLASAHVDAAGPLRPLGNIPFGSGPAGAAVSLPEFGNWARGMGWSLPQRFPELEPAPAETHAQPVTQAWPTDALPAVAPTIEVKPATADAIARAAPNWQAIARKEARSIRKDRSERLGTSPSLEVLGDEVAKVFRELHITGPNGHALAGAYIKRHALQGHGITSPADKLRSMGKHRGK